MTQHQAVNDGVSEAMIEAGVAAFGQTETLSVRRLLEVAYPPMRALDPVLADMREANERLKLEIAAMNNDQLYAPELAGLAGKPVNALTAVTSKKRKFRAALSRSERKDGR